MDNFREINLSPNRPQIYTQSYPQDGRFYFGMNNKILFIFQILLAFFEKMILNVVRKLCEWGTSNRFFRVYIRQRVLQYRVKRAFDRKLYREEFANKRHEKLLGILIATKSTIFISIIMGIICTPFGFSC